MPYKDLIPFISSDDLASFMTVTVNATDLKTKIALDSACDAVRSYLDQEINYAEDDIEYHSGHGYLHDRIRLRQRPVVEVSEVREDMVAGGTGTALDPANYRVRDSFIVRIDGGYFVDGNDNIKITYSHGWMVPPTSMSASIPADIRLVALSAARRVYSGIGAADTAGYGGETIGDYSYTTPDGGKGSATSVAELLMAERDVLDRYRIGLVP